MKLFTSTRSGILSVIDRDHGAEEISGTLVLNSTLTLLIAHKGILVYLFSVNASDLTKCEFLNVAPGVCIVTLLF
jgi:hypothetical protein